MSGVDRAPRARGVAALAAALLVVAGCTGSNEPEDVSSGSPTASVTAPTSVPTTATSSPATSSAVTSDAPPTASTDAPDVSALGLPDAAALQRARADVAELSDEQLVGSLVVASYGGTDPVAAADLVRAHHLAGVITLGGNVPQQPADRVASLRSLSEAVTSAVQQDGRDWPAFLAVDQEGGPIVRVGAPLDHWPAAMALGAADDPALATQVAQASGEQLRALGYTVVFAPDADVTAGPSDPTIGARSPGSSPRLVADIAQAQALGFARAGLVPVVKHFPGHGTVSADTHLGAVVQDADLAVLQKRDLVPFRALVDAGVPAVMTAHIVVRAVDPDRPASLSPAVLTGLLREDLGFQGLVVTDALNMAAVTDLAGPGDAAVAAVQAGADVVLMPTDPASATAALLAALDDGRLTRERVEESAARMVATLRHAEAVPAPGPAVIGSQPDFAVTAALAGLTQLSGPCGQRLVGESISVQGGTSTTRAYLETAAAQAGLGVGGGDVVVLVGGADYQAGGAAGGPGSGAGAVVVATDVPYALAGSTASSALLAAYGSDPATMKALVQVLLGTAPAHGRLPVAVGDYPVGSGCG